EKMSRLCSCGCRFRSPRRPEDRGKTRDSTPCDSSNRWREILMVPPGSTAREKISTSDAQDQSAENKKAKDTGPTHNISLRMHAAWHRDQTRQAKSPPE